MISKEKKGFNYSSKDLIKSTIKFLLYRHGKLTAADLQYRIGLKRQSTYNYLNELLSSNEITVDYEPKPGKPNWNISYYSIKRRELPKELQNSSYTERVRNQDPEWDDKKKRMIDVFNMNIAAIIEAKAALANMSDEEFKSYIVMKPDVWGIFTSIFLLTDEEYIELQLKFKKLINNFIEKSKEKDNLKQSGNIFSFGFIRNY